MNYYNENTNKIRRRKVSSKDSVSRPISSDNSIERKKNINSIKSEEIKKRGHRSRRNDKIRKNRLIRTMSLILLVALVICSAIGSVVTISALRGAPRVTRQLVEDNYISSQVVSTDKIPNDLKNALIAIEDQRFYKHNGVDYKSLVRSVVHNIFSDTTQGGSTIEMQISKNLLTNDDKNIKRKIRDMYNAIQIDKIMSKDEILGVYLNNVYFGKSSYGVAKASRTYFGKDVSDLTLAQSAMLVGITNNPAKYSDHSEAKKRQETILYKMHQLGYITEEEYKEALYDKVPFKSEIE
ncbi:transglycosylase [Romboutsia ilealis]|uniref:Penicillin-binding protein 1A n=1 Tax=Romboutsia faecis TaxID=2764597 RepID=A0ABR7JKX1_9FIRM|nr:biosynthetic peptidoglycan transglycosylase [Romboutsia faecis]MBC5995578.1 transglycosylase domain-containing protein [Romboutsia faecis]MRN23780.1 transglycosylase [Romboutsia ilealis]